MAARKPRKTTSKSKTPSRPTLAYALGAGALAAGAAVAALLTRRFMRGQEGHVPHDLMRDSHPGPNDRADPAFRPDPTAVPTAAEREALAPATIPGPTATDITVEQPPR